MNTTQAQQAAYERGMAEAKQEVELLQQLQLHPGWHIVKRYLDSEMATVLRDMTKIGSQTGESALKATIAYTYVSKIRDWPAERERTLSMSLAQQKK